MVHEATVTEIDHVPALANMIRSQADHERPNPFVTAGLLMLLPTQCGSDGVLYRRQTSAMQAAAAYEAAVAALRPRARLVWHVVPDGNGWRWWAVLLPAGDSERV